MKSSEILSKINSPKELLKYMEKNITYGFVGNNNKVYIDQESNDWNDWYDVCIVQNGNQVLESNIGICWDQVELERLWFSKHNYNFVTIFIWFSVDYKNNYPTHSFLLFEENNKWYWFENAFFDYTGIHEYSSKENALNDIQEKFFNQTLENGWAKPEDRKYVQMNEYSKPKDNLTVQEYLNHVTGNK